MFMTAIKTNVARDLTPKELEEPAYRRNVRSKVEAGIRSAEAGKAWSLAAARDHLKRRIRARAARAFSALER
jgi:hypothetical protein